MDDLTDADLLDAWLAGDQEAYAVLVARHHGLVRTACQRAAPPGEADDCVQAVFLVLARRGRQAARAPALVAWLLRTACLVCRCARRSRDNRRRAEAAAATIPRAASAPRSEAFDHLDECLQRLPERQRVAVAMHYLAGDSPEAVAAALGTNRNNVYQLLNRGLTGLRDLLARRGVAMGSAALAGLLAAEVQAAAAPVPATAITAITTAPPSAAATTLASGAITAMTIAILIPVASAAGLLLAAAIATVALTAEPALVPATPPAPVSIPAPVSAAAWSLPDDPRLEKRMTLGTVQISVEDYLNSVRQFTGLNISADRCGQVPVSLRVREMRAVDILVWLAIQANARIEVHGTDLRLVASASPIVEPPAMGSPDDAGIHKELLKPFSLDFQETDIADVHTFLRVVSHSNLVIHPACTTSGGGITLRVKEMPIRDILAWVAKITNCRVVIRNGAIGILPANLWTAPAPAAGPPPATGF